MTNQSKIKEVEEVIDNFYSLSPKYRTKDKLKEVITTYIAEKLMRVKLALDDIPKEYWNKYHRKNNVVRVIKQHFEA